MPLKKSVTSFNTISSVVFSVSLLFMGLVINNSHTSADTMDHGMHSTQNCASNCTSSQRVALKHEIIVLQNKKDTPAPPPNEPYYLQFQSMDFSRPIFPRKLIYNSSFKPPDLNRLNSVFRF